MDERLPARFRKGDRVVWNTIRGGREPHWIVEGIEVSEGLQPIYRVRHELSGDVGSALQWDLEFRALRETGMTDEASKGEVPDNRTQSRPDPETKLLRTLEEKVRVMFSFTGWSDGVDDDAAVSVAGVEAILKDLTNWRLLNRRYFSDSAGAEPK